MAKSTPTLYYDKDGILMSMSQYQQDASSRRETLLLEAQWINKELIEVQEKLDALYNKQALEGNRRVSHADFNRPNESIIKLKEAYRKLFINSKLLDRILIRVARV